MNEVLRVLKEQKTYYELPNDNSGEYNQGFVKACNMAINLIEGVMFDSDEQLRTFYESMGNTCWINHPSVIQNKVFLEQYVKFIERNIIKEHL